jgi:hypothetical protein
MTRLSRRSPGKVFSTITATSCTNTVRPIIAFTNSLYHGLASLRRRCNISDVHPCTHGSAASDVWLDGLPVTDVSAHLTSISTLQSALEWRWGQTTGYLLDSNRDIGSGETERCLQPVLVRPFVSQNAIESRPDDCGPAKAVAGATDTRCRTMPGQSKHNHTV